MNLFRKIIGAKREAPLAESDFEEDIRAMAVREEPVARPATNSGLVALYPELGKSQRRRKRGFADLDFDEYVPELDDYEPDSEGEFLSNDRESADRVIEERLANVRERLKQDTPEQKAEAPAPAEPAKADDAPKQASRPMLEIEATQAKAPAPMTSHDDEDEGDAVEAVAVADDFDDEPQMVEVPAPAVGRSGGRRAGRVKTRLLGFDHAGTSHADPFEAAHHAAVAAGERFPVGWIVVLQGPGRGASFTLFNGVSPIGRGDDQSVRLDFGDTSISRTSHAMVAYDSEQQKFFLGHSGKANLVRLNGKPLLSTEELKNNDLIRIGETTLRFIALCGPDFDWTKDQEAESVDAAIA